MKKSKKYSYMENAMLSSFFFACLGFLLTNGDDQL